MSRSYAVFDPAVVAQNAHLVSSSISAFLQNLVFSNFIAVFSVIQFCCVIFIMVALCNRADHYIFAMWFLSSIYLSIFFFFLA